MHQKVGKLGQHHPTTGAGVKKRNKSLEEDNSSAESFYPFLSATLSILSMKIYCKHCKWFRTERRIVKVLDNNYVQRITLFACMFDHPTGKLANSFISAQTKNKNLDCENYKRQWYKCLIK